MNIPYVNYLKEPEGYLKSVHIAWKRFIETGSTDGVEIRNEVAESWRMSMENGLTPSGPGAELVLDEKMLQKINQKSSPLLNAADSVISEFADMMQKRGSSNCVINLCNEETVILRTVSCGTAGEQCAEYQHILPGAILDEKHTGTTSVSLARATKLPYALYGAEHFRQSARICSCAAVPITNVRNNQMKGIIALSGEAFEIVPDTIGMVTFIARTIEGNLLRGYAQNEEALMNSFREQLRRNTGGLIVMVDADLNVLVSSSNTHSLICDMLGVRKLDKCVTEVLKRVNEKYLYGQTDKMPENMTVEETTLFCMECRPVYRMETYVGMALTIWDKTSVSQMSGAAAVRTGKPRLALAGHTPAFRRALDMALSVAPTDAPVMLLGETGTGKEIFAKAIHENSKRAKKPYIAINCGALPRELIGSELFGYASGAFTGASQKGNVGKLEAADCGTIFLDELGAMPLDAQSYLLRVIEERELYRLGSTKPIPIDVRIICATNENLNDLIEAKLFRADLYYRLNVVEIKIPPLRERIDDLAELVNWFSVKYTGEPCVLDDTDMAVIGDYAWPGNVREIKNVLHSASVLKVDPALALKNYVAVHKKAEKNLPKGLLELAFPMSDIEKQDYVIKACGGNITKAARQLGVARSTIYRRMKRLEGEA